jgi:predicted nucleic acid-binding Zn ribbon protein
MPFSPIGDTLQDKVNQNKPLQKQMEAGQIVEIAEEIFKDLFGAEEAIHVKPLFLKNRTLTVTCSSSTVAQEIRLNQGEIVDRINEKMGKKEVDRIRYLS